MRNNAQSVTPPLLWILLFWTTIAMNPVSDLNVLKPRTTSKTVHVPLHMFSLFSGYPDEYFYYVNVTLGTPKTTGAMAVAFMWGDLWAFRFFCSKSSTCIINSDKFNYTEGNDTFEAGSFAKDTMSIEGINSTFSNFQFVVNEPGPNSVYDNYTVEVNGSFVVVSYTGVLGLGLPVNQGFLTTQYPSLGQTLVNNGAINSYSFSLWQDQLNSKTGNLLFGGIDPFAYTGRLTTLNWTVRAFDRFNGFQPMITLQDLSIVTGNLNRSFTNSSGLQLAATFSTATYLASHIIRPLWAYLGVDYSENTTDTPEPLILCSQRSNTSTLLRFKLGADLILEVPIGQIISTTPRNDGKWCAIYLREAKSTEPMSLGLNMVQRLYAVYDYPNGQVSFGINSFASKKMGFVEIPVGGVRAIPTTSPSPAPVETTKSSAPESISSSSKALPIGLGVGIPCTLILIGVIFLLYRRHIRREREGVKDGSFTKAELLTGNEVFQEGELRGDMFHGAELDAGHGVSEVDGVGQTKRKDVEPVVLHEI